MGEANHRENRRAFSISHDYIVCFARNKLSFEIGRGLLPLSEEAAERYANPDGDPRGEWQSVSLNAQAGHATKAQFYELTTPGGRLLEPPTGRCWSVTKERLGELIADNRVWFGRDGMNVPRLKHFRSEAGDGLTPHTLWRAGEVGTNDSAKKHLLHLLGDEALFDTPKPVELLTRMVQIGAPGQQDMVLDFFAGSGTLAEAVMAANQESGANRHYFLVQIPEPAASNSGINLTALIRKRVVAGTTELSASAPQLGGDMADVGFRAYRLSQSNFSVWVSDRGQQDLVELVQQLEFAVDHIAEGATESSLLTELLLKAGFPLTSLVEVVSFAGVRGYSVADGALLVCLADALTIGAFEAMSDRDPAMILVLDAGFGGSDELKVNALQTVRARNLRSGGGIALKVV